MLKLMPLSIFMGGLLLGVGITISSGSWFGVWFGMELNLLSFVPVMMLGGVSEVGVVLKYFLVQASASLVLLQMGIFMHLWGGFASWCILFSLVLKLGGAPVHFWFPSVSEGLSWMSFGLLMSLQKFSPLVILFYTGEFTPPSGLLGVVVLCSLVGALGGLNELLVRSLLSFSSIAHLGWMFTGLLLGWIWFIYYIFYCVVLVTLLIPIYRSGLKHLSQIKNLSLNLAGIGIGVGFMSLGGLPPLLGFLPKWVAIVNILPSHLAPVLLILLVSSVITLFYYMRFSLSVYLIHSLAKVSSPLGGGVSNLMLHSCGLMLVCSFLWGVDFCINFA